MEEELQLFKEDCAAYKRGGGGGGGGGGVTQLNKILEWRVACFPEHRREAFRAAALKILKEFVKNFYL